MDNINIKPIAEAWHSYFCSRCANRLSKQESATHVVHFSVTRENIYVCESHMHCICIDTRNFLLGSRD